MKLSDLPLFLRTTSTYGGNGLNYAVTWQPQENPGLRLRNFLSVSDIEPWILATSWCHYDEAVRQKQVLVLQEGLNGLSSSRVAQLHGYSNISSGRCRVMIADVCHRRVEQMANLVNSDRFVHLLVF